MKTILVPVDFSEVSRNAAYFAGNLCNEIGPVRLILFNMFDNYMSGSDGSLMQDDQEDRKEIRLMSLYNVCREFEVNDTVTLECKAEAGGSLVHTLNKVVADEEVDMIIMGITGASRLEQIFIGSNTLRLLKHATIPILVIPPEVKFTGCSNLLLAADLDGDSSHLPKSKIEALLHLFPMANLHIVYVNTHNNTTLNEHQQSEKVKLENWLELRTPEFHIIAQTNFIQAINSFVTSNKIDILLTVPKTNAFLNGIFKHTHTGILGYNSVAPFIAVHE